MSDKDLFAALGFGWDCSVLPTAVPEHTVERGLGVLTATTWPAKNRVADRPPIAVHVAHRRWVRVA